MNKTKYLLIGSLSLLLFACNDVGGGDKTNSNLKFNVEHGTTGSTCDSLPTWSKDVAYATGGTHVQYEGFEYENTYWTQNDNPKEKNGPKGSGSPWIQLNSCGDAPAPDPSPLPSTTPLPAPTNTPPGPKPTPGQYPVYPEGRGTYTGGTIVQSADDGTLYECLNASIAPWCNSPADWAYAPGTGTAWKDAWKEVGDAPKPSPTPPGPSPTPPGPGPGPDESSSVLFSPYKDVTLWIKDSGKFTSNVTGSKSQVVDIAVSHKIPAVTWAFATGSCDNEVWNNSTPDIIAANKADFVSKGIKYIVSTGGQAGKFSCGSDAGMLKFTSKYMTANMIGLDFDIEAAYSQAEAEAMVKGALAVQKQYPNVRISYTLATYGNGSDSVDANSAQFIKIAQRVGLKFNVNLMVMDYYSSCTRVNNKCDMNLSAQNAAVAMHKTYNVSYSNIEVTPMIGVNDAKEEVFTLDDAKNLATWTKSQNLGGLHFWAFDRDTSLCSNSEVASWDCSSIIGLPAQQTKPLEYTDTFISVLGGKDPGPGPGPAECTDKTAFETDSDCFCKFHSTDSKCQSAPPPAPTGQNIVGYWGSWSTQWGDANSVGIANLPPFINTVLISFVQPGCHHATGRLDCGLQFSMDMDAIKGAIANAHKKNPNVKFLLSIGGANYPFSQPMTKDNADSLVALMTEMGADGLDLDYETHPSCSNLDTAQVKCNTDTEVIQLINTLKTALPKGKLLTAATWSVGAYGNDKFPVSKYQPSSDYSGMFINPLKQVGNKLDEIFIMSYDAGSIAGTGYNPKQALDAYSDLFPKAKIYLGLEVPYEAWPNHITGQAQVLTVPMAMDYAAYAKQQGAGGVMLWSLNKVSDVNGETANDYLKPICTAYGLQGCDKTIPIK